VYFWEYALFDMLCLDLYYFLCKLILASCEVRKRCVILCFSYFISVSVYVRTLNFEDILNIFAF
jgi:hypothetical protein